MRSNQIRVLLPFPSMNGWTMFISMYFVKGLFAHLLFLLQFLMKKLSHRELEAPLGDVTSANLSGKVV